MKAVSLWQPWASCIATGAKTIETRPWQTRYRGELAIHAAKRRVVGELLYLLSTWSFQGALAPLVGKPLDLEARSWAGVRDHHLPFGAIVAVARIVACRPTERVPHGDVQREGVFGDFSPGRFAWYLEDVRALSEPIACRGRQGLFDLNGTIAAAVRERLP